MTEEPATPRCGVRSARFRSITVVALVVAAATFVAASAGANGTLGPMTIAPAQAPAGGQFSVSGTGCSASEFGTHESGALGANTGQMVTVTISFPTPIVDGPFQANDGGSWSRTYTVPTGIPPGAYAINATCSAIAESFREVDAQQVGSIPYDAASITVTVTEAASAPAEVVTAAPRTTG